MKKIMLTLCTLLAVNAGSTMYAGGRVVDGKAPEKGKENKAEPARPGETQTGRNEPTAAQKANNNKSSSASSGSKSNAANSASTSSSSSLVTELGIDLNEVQTKSTKLTELNENKTNARNSSVIHQNLNIIKEMNGGKTSEVEPSEGDKNAPKNSYDQTFNLDSTSQMNVKFSQGSSKESGKPIESTKTSYKKIRKDKYETTTTKTTYNADGSMTETVFKDNPNYNEKAAKNSGSRVKYDVQKTIASHSIKYNKDGSVEIKSLDANSNPKESTYLTKDEAREGLKKEVAEKKSSMTDEQTAEAQARQAEAQARQAEAQARQNLVDKTANDVSKPLEEGNQAEVEKNLSENLEEPLNKTNMNTEEKTSLIKQLTDKIMEIGKSGKQSLTATIDSIRSAINSFLDFVATRQFRTSAPEVAVEGTDPEADSNNGVNKNEDYQDAPRPGSPKGVDAVDSLDATSEEQGLF